VPVALAAWRHGLAAPAAAWAGFAYVAIISQFLGFFAWYRGLALGGVARVSQLQLLQPFFTLVASAFLLGERLTPATILIALVVVVAVAVGRTATVIRGSQATLPTDHSKGEERLRIARDAVHNPRRE
jgi:drug/metabolite transporter (DMT)-like permease